MEADHFARATNGVNEALTSTPQEDRNGCLEAVYAGFSTFVGVHHDFFTEVGA